MVSSGRVLALAFALLLTAGCGAPAPSTEAPRPNIVFVLIDTLRADRLGCYGYSRDTSPFIDSLAASGTLFDNVDAQSSWTAPAMASIWTSRYPAESGVAAQAGPDGLRMIDRHSASALSEEHATLAELAQAQGYLTIAAIANTWASDHVGLLRGFRVWSRAGGRAATVLGKAMSVIQQSQREKPMPFFAYLHAIDVHEPTTTGEPHRKRHGRWEFGNDRQLDSEEFRNFRSHKEALYDGSIGYVDEMLRQFMKKLDERGLADNTLIVVTSDHGEELWDSPVFSEDMAYGNDAKALQDDGFKYIRYEDHPQRPTFLFDLNEDTEEKNNLVEIKPELAAEYEQKPSEWVAVASPEELERLKALGYLD